MAARNALDAVEVMDPKSKEVDSLKILCYQAELGPEFLATTIDAALDRLEIVCDENEEHCVVELPLDTKNSIQLNLTIVECVNYAFRDKTLVKAEWLASFKRSSLYALIKNRAE